MKTVDILDIITVCDLKVYRCRLLIELMKVVDCRSMPEVIYVYEN